MSLAPRVYGCLGMARVVLDFVLVQFRSVKGSGQRIYAFNT